jgi:hypothetical protein
MIKIKEVQLKMSIKIEEIINKIGFMKSNTIIIL